MDENGDVKEPVVWNFDPTVLSTLDTYRRDNGWIGIGLDPDCHYWNDGVRLVINTVSVPEPTSFSLLFLGLSLFGGSVFMRRRRS
jgi:hypothetical protein